MPSNPNKPAKKVVANYTIRGNILPIMSFGEDEQGEIYYTTDTGSIYRLRQIGD